MSTTNLSSRYHCWGRELRGKRSSFWSGGTGRILVRRGMWGVWMWEEGILLIGRTGRRSRYKGIIEATFRENTSKKPEWSLRVWRKFRGFGGHVCRKKEWNRNHSIKPTLSTCKKPKIQLLWSLSKTWTILLSYRKSPYQSLCSASWAKGHRSSKSTRIRWRTSSRSWW